MRYRVDLFGAYREDKGNCMPFRLVYSSEATPGLKIEELQSMLAQARINNQALGITGVLVFVEGVFLQILEGDNDKVMELTAKIERDPRHHGVKVFHSQEAGERAFTSWNMAYLSPDTKELSSWAGLDGATTIEDIMSRLESEPDRLPRVLVNILRMIA